jgi:hypothetical protein
MSAAGGLSPMDVVKMDVVELLGGIHAKITKPREVDNDGEEIPDYPKPELEIKLYANTGEAHLAMVSVALVFDPSQIQLPAAAMSKLDYSIRADGTGVWAGYEPGYNDPADKAHFRTQFPSWQWGD